MLDTLFNKITRLKACDFNKKRLQHRCFPVTFREYLFQKISSNGFFYFTRDSSCYTHFEVIIRQLLKKKFK